jgi:hypothetical protein
MLGWVLASASILVGFVVISGATRIDGEEADHRRANSPIPQQAKMFRSQTDPISRAIVDGVIHSQQNHITVPTPQPSALSEKKDTLDGKEVRRALPVDVRTSIPDQPATPERAD